MTTYSTLTARFISSLAQRAPWEWWFNGERVEPTDLADPEALGPLVLAAAVVTHNGCMKGEHRVCLSNLFETSPDALLRIAIKGVPPIPEAVLYPCIRHGLRHVLGPQPGLGPHAELGRHIDLLHRINEPDPPWVLLAGLGAAVPAAPAQNDVPETDIFPS